MICYKCDVCGEIHNTIGEMHKVKISYAGRADVVYQNNGEYLLCTNCEDVLVKLLNGNDVSASPFVRCTDCILKEQEPILLENQHKPYGISTNANSPWVSRCPRCGKKVEGKQTRFCKYCGQAVKWNDH